MGEAARQVFGIGSDGFIIVQLVSLGVAGWLADLVLGAVNQARIAGMTRTGIIIVAILLVVKVAYKLVEKFYLFTQGTM